MNGETPATLKDFDDKIAQLTEERDRAKRLLEDPEQRTEREKLRERLTGLYVMDLDTAGRRGRECVAAFGDPIRGGTVLGIRH